MPSVAIALGSNLGDREAHLAFGAAALASILSNLRHSHWHDTAPVGVSPDQPRYLNGVVVGDTGLTPAALMERLLAIEREAGRARAAPLAPRTLDLDLILYGNELIEEPAVTVPHPRFRERLFVLEPLAELAPGWIDPATSQTVSALLRQARRAYPNRA